MAPGGLASIKRGRAYPGRFPALGGGMLAAQGGYVFGDAHSPPGRPVPLAAPRWDQVPPVLCCAWVDGDRCAGVSGVICTVQAGSPHLPNAAGVCLRGRLTGQHAWCCVALRWRNLKVRSPALVPGSPEQQSGLQNAGNSSRCCRGRHVVRCGQVLWSLSVSRPDTQLGREPGLPGRIILGAVSTSVKPSRVTSSVAASSSLISNKACLNKQCTPRLLHRVGNKRCTAVGQKRRKIHCSKREVT